MSKTMIKKIKKGKKELLDLVEKHTLNWKDYHLTPIVERHYSLLAQRNTASTRDLESAVNYSFESPNEGTMHFSCEQLEALFEFFKMMEYDNSFDDIVNPKETKKNGKKS